MCFHVRLVISPTLVKMLVSSHASDLPCCPIFPTYHISINNKGWNAFGESTRNRALIVNNDRIKSYDICTIMLVCFGTRILLFNSTCRGEEGTIPQEKSVFKNTDSLDINICTQEVNAFGG